MVLSEENLERSFIIFVMLLCYILKLPALNSYNFYKLKYKVLEDLLFITGIIE